MTSKQERWCFVGDTIRPVSETGDAKMMAQGLPGVPRRFHWGERVIVVRKAVAIGKSLGPCTSGSDERYVRKHHYRVETEDGEVLRLTCDRGPRPGQKRSTCWRVYAVLRSCDDS